MTRMIVGVAALAVGRTAGCGGAQIPNEKRDPELVCVVTSMESVGGTEHVFLLESGPELRIDSNDVDRIAGSAPVVGDLLLYGRDPDAGELVCRVVALRSVVGWLLRRS